MELEVGAVLEGKVTGITAFGAFVALPEGKSGLVHISEVANTYVSDIHAFLAVGQSVKVRVLNISPEGKIGLSIKKAVEQPASPRPVSRRPEQRRPEARSTPTPVRRSEAPVGGYVPQRSEDQGFEDKLKQFMQESEHKMSGNKLFEKQKKTRRK